MNSQRSSEDVKVISDMKEIISIVDNFEEQINNLYLSDPGAKDLKIPLFSSASKRNVVSEWSERPLQEWVYRQDPCSLSGDGFSATVILDTIPKSQNTRTTTMVIRFPRLVLSEFNTHRVFSRNSASSRARSVRTTIDSVIRNPVIPIFTKNKPGMSGPFIENSKYEEAKNIVESARDNSVISVLELLIGSDKIDKNKTSNKDIESYIDYYYESVYKNPDSDSLSIHKQAANRLLEPYLWHEVVVTSSEWVNFFKLRLDLSTTDPHMLAIAYLMAKAYIASFKDEDSNILVNAKAHFPFIDKKESLSAGNILKDLPKIACSVSEAATISYKDKNGEKIDETKALSLTKRLLQLSHSSPFEHVAYYIEDDCKLLKETLSSLGLDVLSDKSFEGKMSGNFSHLTAQLRVMLDNSDELRNTLLSL